MTIVDSSVWIDFFNGAVSAQTDALKALMTQGQAAHGDLILAEVLQGFRSEKDAAVATAVLELYPSFSLAGPEVALASAQNYRLLRRKGLTVRKTIDTLIGTFCIRNDYPLLFSDKDFLPLINELGLIAAIGSAQVK